jgi:hypothetical protein
MRNPMLVILWSAACLFAASTDTAVAQKHARSYDEFRQLAISRGDIRPSVKAAARYRMRKAAGLTTQPTGFIARCMAGIQD